MVVADCGSAFSCEFGAVRVLVALRVCECLVFGVWCFVWLGVLCFVFFFEALVVAECCCLCGDWLLRTAAVAFLVGLV